MLGALHLSTHQSSPPAEAPLRAIIDQVDQGPLRDIVERIFYDLTRLLGYLSRFKLEMDEIGTAGDVLPQFMLVEGEGRILLDFIDGSAAPLEGLSREVHTALEGASYVLRHELERVFEVELQKLSETEPASLLPRIIHAHGILSNCFQQATITLARAFNAKLDAADLFDDVEIRREQSLLLEHDLSTLIRLTQRAEEDEDEYSIVRLIKSVNDFSNGSMRYLMFRDWKTFEHLSRQVVDARSNAERAHLLHRFTCYLEVLYAHVKMRAALSPDSD